MPTVDRGVELQTRVGALPGGLSDLTPQVAGVHRLDHRAVGDRAKTPIGVLDHGLHELVGHADRVVGVLVLDRERVGAIKVHIEASVAEHARLALLLDLAPHELLDIGVVDVEDDHLGRATGLATRLDGAGRGVGTAHEADRTRGRAAALEELGARANLGEVDAGAGATLEDDAFLAVPVEDRVHRVVDRQEEAGARLLAHAGHADVEPDRAVEGRALGDEDVLQFVGEGGGLILVGEVAALTTPQRDRVDDTVDDLTDRGLALGGSEGAAEVLLGDDVGGVHRPRDGELDIELLEGDRAVLPVGDASVATLPDHLVVGVNPRRTEQPLDADRSVRWGEGCGLLGCHRHVFTPCDHCRSSAARTCGRPARL